MPENDWLSYTVTAMIGLITGLSPTVLKWVRASRAITTREWKAIVDDLRERIISLEAKYDTLQREHSECTAKAARLEVKIEMLEAKAEADRGPNRNVPATM